MNARSRQVLVTAGVLIALATALGAFGTHGLRPKLAPAVFESFETAVSYHFYHALGLLGIGAVIRDGDNLLLRWAARLVVIGIALFAGSLYLITFGMPKAIGVVTPLGGVCLMLAWTLFAVGISRPRD